MVWGVWRLRFKPPQRWLQAVSATASRLVGQDAMSLRDLVTVDRAFKSFGVKLPADVLEALAARQAAAASDLEEAEVEQSPAAWQRKLEDKSQQHQQQKMQHTEAAVSHRSSAERQQQQNGARDRNERRISSAAAPEQTWVVMAASAGAAATTASEAAVGGITAAYTTSTGSAERGLRTASKGLKRGSRRSHEIGPSLETGGVVTGKAGAVAETPGGSPGMMAAVTKTAAAIEAAAVRLRHLQDESKQHEQRGIPRGRTAAAKRGKWVVAGSTEAASVASPAEGLGRGCHHSEPEAVAEPLMECSRMPLQPVPHSKAGESAKSPQPPAAGAVRVTTWRLARQRAVQLRSAAGRERTRTEGLFPSVLPVGA